jgi:hypothetical protein
MLYFCFLYPHSRIWWMSPSEVGTISVIAITLRYEFALLHNALYLWRIVIASKSYRLRLFVGGIAYDSYRSELAGQRSCLTLLSF